MRSISSREQRSEGAITSEKIAFGSTMFSGLKTRGCPDSSGRRATSTSISLTRPFSTLSRADVIDGWLFSRATPKYAT